MKITIFGTGYVGLVQGACMADLGHDVLCVDIDSEKIDKLNNNEVPFYEPGLSDLIKRNKEQGNLKFSIDSKLGVEFGEIIFIAVGTPQSESGEANLESVYQVAKTIAENMIEYRVIVNKSTVPPLTAKKVREIIQNNLKNNIQFSVVSNPEFLREGCAVKDFLIPDRVIVGLENNDTKSEKAMKKIYSQLTRVDKPLVFTDTTTSEIIKYASNTLLATKISFMNELSNFTESIGADIKIVAKGVGLDNRIGPKFLQAGCGYGGACFPKDIKALIYEMKKNNISCELVESVERVNEKQKKSIIKRINKLLPDLKNKTVAVWGLSFKPNTDDTRGAPSRTIINDLLLQNAKIKVFDPEAMNNFKKEFPNLEYVKNAYEAANNVDAIILITEWNIFREIDLSKIKKTMKQANFIDCRNIYDPKEMKDLGFNYLSIGRP